MFWAVRPWVKAFLDELNLPWGVLGMVVSPGKGFGKNKTGGRSWEGGRQPALFCCFSIRSRVEKTSYRDSGRVGKQSGMKELPTRKLFFCAVTVTKWQRLAVSIPLEWGYDEWHP